MTAPVTAISGRSWPGRTRLAVSCLPRRSLIFRLRLISRPSTAYFREGIPLKSFILSALALAAPAALLAQTVAPKAAPKAAAPSASSSPAAKASPAAKPKSSPEATRRSALKAVEEVTPIDDDPSVTLGEADLELAKRVYVGTIPCELGASVTITPSDRRPGFFMVQTGKTRFRMHPVASRTGAIRLEDGRAGAMWLQLGNKSMLMSQKHGQRLADECMSPAQVTFADDMKKNPRPSILDAPTVPPVPAEAGTGSAAPAMPAASAAR